MVTPTMVEAAGVRHSSGRCAHNGRVNLAVWAPLLMPLLVVPLARLPDDRLPPRAASWLLAATMAGLAACSTLALALLAGDGLLRLPFVAAFGDLSLPLLRRVSPAAVPLACAAGPVLAVLAGLAARTARHRLAELARARRTVGAAGTGLAVLPEDFPDAYAVPGRPGRVVVTAGMLRVLGARDRQALLAHERAHLAGRHHWFVIVADIAAALHPALAVLRAPLQFQLERWADESAVQAVGDRRVVAHAIARAALAKNRAARTPGPRAVLAATAGPVPRRVAALLEEPAPPVRRGPLPGAALALAACLTVSCGGALDAATDLHGRMEAVETHPVVHAVAHPAPGARRPAGRRA